MDGRIEGPDYQCTFYDVTNSSEEPTRVCPVEEYLDMYDREGLGVIKDPSPTGYSLVCM